MSLSTRYLTRGFVDLAIVLFALALVLTHPTPGYGQLNVASEADVATLQACTGRYQASPDMIITVRRSDRGLSMEVNFGPPLEFVPDAKDHFVDKQSGTKIRFLRNQSGEVTDLVLERGGDHQAKRIPDLLASEPFRIVDVNGAVFRTVISGNGSTPVVLLTGGDRQLRESDALERKIRPADFEKGAEAVAKAHQAWIAKIPNGRLVVVPRAGHDVPSDQPEYVITAIQQELNEMITNRK